MSNDISPHKTCRSVLSRFGSKLLVQRRVSHQRGNVMKRFSISFALVVLLAGAAGIGTPARAEIGRVAVIFTKGGFGVGGTF